MDRRRLGKRLAIMYPIAKILLQLVMASALIFLLDQPYFALLVLNQAVMFSLQIEFLWLPLKDRVSQIQVIVNELTLLFMVYNIICLTEIVPIHIRMFQIGNIILVSIVASSLLFILFYAGPIVTATQRRCKQRARKTKNIV